MPGDSVPSVTGQVLFLIQSQRWETWLCGLGFGDYNALEYQDAFSKIGKSKSKNL